MTSATPHPTRAGEVGSPIAYDMHGSGRPVVLLGGTGMPRQAWEGHYVPALVEGGFCVVTVDAPGCGTSPPPPPAGYSITDMADHVAALMTQLDLTPFVAIGLSWGGFVAEELAVRHRDGVEAAVMIGATGRTTAFTRAVMTAQRELHAQCRPPLSHHVAQILSSCLSRDVLQNDDAAVDNWRRILGTVPWESRGVTAQTEAAWGWLLDTDRAARWPDITARCLIVTFGLDLCFPPRTAREAAAGIPDCRLLEIPGVAHGPGPFESAATISDEIVAFLGASSPPSPVTPTSRPE